MLNLLTNDAMYRVGILFGRYNVYILDISEHNLEDR
jgi:hypothetical protein